MSVGNVLSHQPSRSAAIELRDLSYAVTTQRGRLEILDGLSLRVEPGEFVSIVGPSGCGKSTILNLVSGLVSRGWSGHIHCEGEPVEGVTPRIGYMFQRDGLLPWRTVLANVELGLELAGVAPTARHEKAVKLLEELGLKGFEHHFPAEISGGMSQRVALARTLAVNPDILLMDEPFGALDAQTKLIVQDLFLRHWEEHRKTVLFVTHDLHEAIALSDRIVMLSPRPARIVRQYRVRLPRPRDPISVTHHPETARLWMDLWSDLKPVSDATPLVANA